MQVSSFVAPPNAFSGLPIDVQFTVGNLSNQITDVNRWFDAIYLSDDTTFNQLQDRLLKTFIRQSTLAPDSSHTISARVLLPAQVFGQYNLLAIADLFDNVFEDIGEGNNTRRSEIDITLTPPPDLVVTNISSPDQVISGSTIDVEWTVQNQGPGSPYEYVWYDRLYLSSSDTLDAENATLLSTFYRSGTLDPDSAYSAMAAVTLPNGISGEHYLFVSMDFDNRVFEHEFENNNVSSPGRAIEVALAPWADLRVISVMIQPDPKAGNRTTLTWQVENIGTSALKNGTWSDRVFVSNSQAFDSTQATLLTEVLQTRSLGIGESYSQNTTIRLPTNLSGDLYFHLFSDANDAIFEYTGEGNNSGNTGQVLVTAYPSADLSVTNLVVPTVGSSGKSIQIQYSVRNNSSAKTLSALWHAAIYLSQNQTFEAEQDILLNRTSRSPGLDAGRSYVRNIVTILPNGVSGSFFVIVIGDVDMVTSDIERGNNLLASQQPISIALSPSPDLTPVSLSTDAQGYAGQPVMVHWQVQNIDAVADGKPWYDAVYLSKNTTLDDTDRKLGRKARSGFLSPGAVYGDSLRVGLPNFESGDFHILIKADSKNIRVQFTNITITQATQIIIVRPLDPNNITGPAGYGDERWVGRGRVLDYRIRFENDPEFATAAAQVVTITQVLDSTLDIRNFRLGSYGFGSHTFEVQGNRSYLTRLQDLSNNLGLFVDISAGIDVTNREAFWIFRSIDPATGQPPENPFSGFLAVNDSLGSGEGLVNYSIAPRLTAQTPERIDAEATIVFDTEEPINTPPVFNTIDASRPSSNVVALDPTQTNNLFDLSWSADDVGAGVRDYSVYINENGGPFQLYQAGITDTAIVFEGQSGISHGFFTVAADHVGNIEAFKSQPDATTIITGVNERTAIPETFALYQNYPNPFNPETIILYDLPQDSQVSLIIFNVLGQRVKTLVDREEKAGTWSIRWDGKNDAGLQVSSGVYLYRFEAGEFKRTSKMLLLR